MAEEKVEPRPVSLRQYFPWFELFRAFQIALDPKKLVLAAAGILAMAFWWWLCSAVFYAAASNKPRWTEYKSEQKPEAETWAAFKTARAQWNLRYETAGVPPAEGTPEREDAGDLADSPGQFDPIEKHITDGETTFTVDGKTYVVREKPHGRLRTWPWFEDRGPNPYLLLFGRRHVPRDEGVFHWFFFNQVPVLIEPIIKFVLPIYYLLHTNIGVVNFLYFSLVLLGTLAVWALFGGAITRMAAVQITRRDKIGLGEAIRFTLSKWGAFFSAPLFPLLGVVVIAALLILYGFIHLIPVFGDIVDGLLWPLVILAGLVMAVILVGLISWPMMYATISTEGSDSFDALSRSYSYVIQSPWHYLWYVLVSLVYGAVVVFFVCFMGSLAVYLGKWGVSENPVTGLANRDPSYLFIYAPTSFGWRALLVQGDPNINPDGTFPENYLKGYNYVGAWMVTVWIYLAFLLMIGFAYSFFWTAGTITYLLMRRNVDDTDLDEVYLDEEEAEEPYTVPPAAPAGAASSGTSLTMVEPPTLKTPAATAATVAPPAPPPVTPAPPRVETGPTQGGDGNAPPPA